MQICSLLLAGIINKNTFSKDTRFEEVHARTIKVHGITKHLSSVDKVIAAVL